ncbi:MAG: molybdenum cofactor biosynthesis protein MoaE [Pseudomonadota bacterium]
MIRVQEEPFSPGAELDAFLKGRTDIGAAASFTGTVRDMTGAADVARLTLDHYPGFTEAEIAKIENSARTRWALQDTLIIHRYGEMRPGEAIVLVVALAAHRRPAFEAADFMMDYLKTDAPFWKKETGPGGDRWIEPRQQDRDDKARWGAHKES